MGKINGLVNNFMIGISRRAVEGTEEK